ncbi:MAG: serine--tRNA ligase, partial [Spirochaetales bacterium]|nr:serine--tRNA ligase [Spirochaetales bacterium]
MLDLKTTLNKLDDVKAAMAARNAQIDFSGLEQLAARRQELIGRYDGGRFEQRQASEQMRTIDKKSQAFVELRTKLKTMSDQLKSWDGELAKVEAEISELLLVIPNLPHASVPIGKDEADNEETTRWGDIPTFDFEPKPHWEIGEALGILDFERGAKVAGARFTFLKGAAARLERA